MLIGQYINLTKKYLNDKDYISFVWSVPFVISAIFVWPGWWFRSPNLESGDENFIPYFYEAFDLGLKYGSQLFSTSGPWSILYYSQVCRCGIMSENTYLVTLASQCFTAVCTAIGLCFVLQKSIDSFILRVIIAGAIFLFLSYVSSVDARLIISTLIIPFIYIYLRNRNFSLIYIIFLFSASLIALSKGTILLIYFPILLILLVSELRKKHFPLYTIFSLVSLFIWGMLANQSPLDIWNYLVSLIEISNTFSQVATHFDRFFFCLALIVITVFFGLYILVNEIRVRGIGFSTAFNIVAYFIILNIVLKTGISSADGQHLIRTGIILPIFFVIYFLNRQSGKEYDLGFNIKNKSDNGKAALLCISILATGGLLGLFAHHSSTLGKDIFQISSIGRILQTTASRIADNYNQRNFIDKKVQRFHQNLAGFTDLAFGSGRDTAIRNKRFKEATRLQFGLDRFAEPATLYVDSIVPFMAADIDFDIVPGMVSQIRGASIERRNEKFLKNSPNNFLVYQGYEFAIPSLAFLQIRSSYYLEDEKKWRKKTITNEDKYLILKKRKKEINYDLTCNSFTNISLDEIVLLPRSVSDFIFLRVLYRRSVFDTIIGLFYKNVHVVIKQYAVNENSFSHEYKSTKYKEYLIDTNFAKNGFIISPMLHLIGEKKDFLTNNNNDYNNVESFSLSIKSYSDPIHSFFNKDIFLKNSIKYQICEGSYRQNT